MNHRVISSSTAVPILLLVFAPFVFAEAGYGEGTLNPLVCRFASYRLFEEAVWTHLPQIGVHHVFMNVPAADQVEPMMKRLGEHGLAATVLRGDTDLSKDAYLGQLTEQIKTCERMGVHYLFLSPKRHDAPKETIYEHLRQAGEVARQHDVIISLETHPDLGTNGEVHLETMKQINHPNVRVNFDTGNISYYNKGADACAELEKIVDYVATVELKDHDGAFETWHFPPVGQGIIDFPGVLKILEKHGYKGPITLEFEGVKGEELDETGTKKAIAESAAYVRSLACLD
jgi:sugar phosphate isomerase/epimerase